MDWTKEEAKAADKVLSELTTVYCAADDRWDGARHRLHREVDDNYRIKYKPDSGWKLLDSEALAKAAEMVGSAPAWKAQQIEKAVALYHETLAALRAASDAIDAHEDIHYKGWPRFFLVPGGHIHRSRSCHSLRITTRIGWLADLSGETIAEAVAAHGTLLCTHCFPDAPVEWTVGNKPKIAEGYCTGQGKVAKDISWRYRSGVGTCVECGQAGVSVSSLGKALKHKLPK
jgi:hypothetical protein